MYMYVCICMYLCIMIEGLQIKIFLHKKSGRWYYNREGIYIYIYIYVYIYIYIYHRPFGIMVIVRQWSGRPGFNISSSHAKDSKMVLDAYLPNIQHYKIRMNGKWNNSLTLGVEAIEKGAFWLLPTTVGQLTLLVHIYLYI